MSTRPAVQAVGASRETGSGGSGPDPSPDAQRVFGSLASRGAGEDQTGQPAHASDDSRRVYSGLADLPPTRDRSTSDSRNMSVAGGDQDSRQVLRDAARTVAGSDPTYALLALHAAALDDVEKARIAAENRARALRLDYGLEGSPQEAALLALAGTLAEAEKMADRQLRKALRACPLGPYIRGTVGIGERQGARLLAATGDPAWHPLHERPRRLRELYAYCGLHVIPAALITPDSREALGGGELDRADDPDPLSSRDSRFASGVGASALPGYAPRPRRGQPMRWSHEARMRAWLIAQSVIKCGGPFRPVYDAGREKYAEAVHLAPCAACSPAGKPPAEPGTPLRPIHQHQRATRLVMKAVVKGLWRESRRIHGWNEPGPWEA